MLVIASCARGEHRAARVKYNEGVRELAKGDYAAAEASLIDARNQAGVDPELRFRAAYDLGVAYAAHAEQAKKPDPKGGEPDLTQALDLEEKAVSWLFDAQRLRKDDADTKTNLAIARARVQALEDELAKGQNKLEARLDGLIEEQRGVLDDARTAWLDIKQAHGADPLAQQTALSHLADLERGILAEAGVVGDLAADEIDAIGKKPDDKRSEQEQVRIVQLKNLDRYLMDGRSRIAEARKKLQDLDAEAGVSRAETALVALKRAREQLLDPITVLRELASEQLELVQQTGTAAEREGGSLLAKPQPDQGPLPAWLTPPALAERQVGLHARVEEIRARLAAAVASKDQPPPKDAKPEQLEQRKKLLERVAAALPHVAAASTAMDTAHGALVADKLDGGLDGERDALVELGKAIEQFADLKQTIDLAAETQHQVVTLLSPEAAKQLPPDERKRETADALASNLARMSRIKDLLAEQAGKLASAPPPKDPKQADAQKQQLEQAKQQLATAETLRADAEKALAATDAAIKAAKDPTASAKLAADKLDQLRELFFTVIEHLQELIRQQGETRDQTSAANADDDFTRAPKLPGLAQRETEHEAMAKAITDALAKQADAMQKQPAQGPPQAGAPSAKTLAQAADEVRLAQNDMTDTSVVLGKAQTAKQSVSLKPAVDSEGKALEHLQNALALLQPPKQNKKHDKNQQQQQQQQQQAQQQQQQQQQGGAGQRARDEDAERQRERQQRHATTDPVDEDW